MANTNRKKIYALHRTFVPKTGRKSDNLEVEFTRGVSQAVWFHPHGSCRHRLHITAECLVHVQRFARLTVAVFEQHLEIWKSKDVGC